MVFTYCRIHFREGNCHFYEVQSKFLLTSKSDTPLDTHRVTIGILDFSYHFLIKTDVMKCSFSINWHILLSKKLSKCKIKEHYWDSSWWWWNRGNICKSDCLSANFIKISISPVQDVRISVGILFCFDKYICRN